MKQGEILKKLLGTLIIIVSLIVLLWLIYYFEKDNPNGNIKSFGDSVWYGFITLTTVGYGDYYPVTVTGKTFGIVIVLCSLGLVGFIVGNISTKITEYITAKKWEN